MSWIKRADTKALPKIEFTVLIDGEVVTKDFFFDERLGEYRPVDNPGERYTQDQMDEMIEEAEVQKDSRGPEIEEDDYVITLAGELGSKYYCAKIDYFTSEWDDMIQEVSDDMAENNFFPNVWFVNDHGNTSLLAITRREDGSTTYNEVKSWV